MRSGRVKTEAYNPIAVGYQAGGILGLLLGGFLADTWLWFSIIVVATASGGLLIGWLAQAVLYRFNQRQRI